MNYVGRKDGGSYISSSQSGITFDSDLLIPIGYDETIAQTAAEMKVKYRDLFILCYKEGKKDGKKEDREQVGEDSSTQQS